MLYIQQDNGNAGKANEYAMERMYAKAECTKKINGIINEFSPTIKKTNKRGLTVNR